ncbi:hypothetical protein V6N12_002798 [Hibiscus sabdariffa]|uniref:Uncharacterized protein n=1 Tax=Hibiscus sabdariffa TaxID=183260 RepID=A0ABR2EA21_9ROSI
MDNLIDNITRWEGESTTTQVDEETIDMMVNDMVRQTDKSLIKKWHANLSFDSVFGSCICVITGQVDHAGLVMVLFYVIFELLAWPVSGYTEFVVEFLAAGDSFFAIELGDFMAYITVVVVVLIANGITMTGTKRKLWTVENLGACCQTGVSKIVMASSVVLRLVLFTRLVYYTSLHQSYYLLHFVNLATSMKVTISGQSMR